VTGFGLEYPGKEWSFGLWPRAVFKVDITVFEVGVEYDNCRPRTKSTGGGKE